MTRQLVIAALLVGAIIVVLSCQNQAQKGERLAHQYCSSCHMFPEPSLLPKHTWDKRVFPQMALLMGLEPTKLFELPEEDRDIVVKIIPQRAMVSHDDWEAIRKYYLAAAPDTLLAPTPVINDTLTHFDVSALRLNISRNGLNTVIAYDSNEHKTYLGTRYSVMYKLNKAMQPEDSLRLPSPVSHMLFPHNEPPLLVSMGLMDPNDQSAGSVFQLLQGKKSKRILDSLQRPVYTEKVDLNGDTRDDYVVCAFGNYTGNLSAYEANADGTYNQHVLQPYPGARRVIAVDFDHNDRPDLAVLMTQGDERVIVLVNLGNFNFRPVTLLRFPPVYGSSYFDMVDFNHDGHDDILYTNGDNADYSPIPKPYHGVRLFMNDGANHFTESWFYPMHGASQARAADYDGDGDVDVAAISFFPDFARPEQGFIYLENTADGMKPRITPLARKGRWLIMESYDYDTDGDEDVVVGSLDFNALVPPALLDEWKQSGTSLLLLRNKTRQ